MTINSSPLSLYRRILRLHRHLSAPMRSLGDDYVKSEFRRHQTVTERRFLDPFFREWNAYAEHLEKTTTTTTGSSAQSSPSATAASSQEQPTRQVPSTTREIGQKLDGKKLEHFSDDQIEQLYALKQETQKARGSVRAGRGTTSSTASSIKQ